MSNRSAELVMEPPVQVSAMATIVQELISGGDTGPQDGVWLHHRAERAGLDTNEYGALEALRVRLLEHGDHLLDADDPIVW